MMEDAPEGSATTKASGTTSLAAAVTTPSAAEKGFFDVITVCGVKPSVLYIVLLYSASFASMSTSLPLLPLTALFDQSMLQVRSRDKRLP